MLYRFNAAEVEMLLSLALANMVECAVEYDADRETRQDLLIAARLLAELHEPTPSMRAALAPGEERAANHLGIDMIEAAQREGIDIEKELGAIDPRAKHPKCIHGRKFSEPCIDCSPIAGASPRVMPFDVSAEERAALDAAVVERRSAGLSVEQVVYDRSSGQD